MQGRMSSANRGMCAMGDTEEHSRHLPMVTEPRPLALLVAKVRLWD